jgi:hypothetical protein
LESDYRAEDENTVLMSFKNTDKSSSINIHECQLDAQLVLRTGRVPKGAQWKGR